MLNLRTRNPLVVFAALGLLLPLGACSPTADDATTESPLEEAVGPGPAAGHGARLRKLMDKLELRADQRARLESLAKDVEARLEPARKLRHGIALELVRELRAGKLDRPRLQALLQTVEAQHQAVRPVVLAALDNLHRTLTPVQRKKLVLALETGRHRRGHHHGLSALRRATKQLGLSDEQLDRIQAVVKSGHGVGARLSRMLKLHDQLDAAKETFLSDAFEASKLEIVQQAPALIRERLAEMIGIGEQVLPLLTAEQRSLAATLLEAHARQCQQAPSATR